MLGRERGWPSWSLSIDAMAYTLISSTYLCSVHLVARGCLLNTLRFIPHFTVVVMVRFVDFMT
jgi:hypothetical protein